MSWPAKGATENRHPAAMTLGAPWPCAEWSPLGLMWGTDALTRPTVRDADRTPEHWNH